MKDFNIYQLRLEQSLNEKLFFASILDLKEYDCIVDFGCGTGALLGKLKTIVDSTTQLIGYDINMEMLRVCEERYSDIEFTNNLNKIKKMIEGTKSLVIFSTVLHEISENTQLEIIRSIMPLFHTVVVRDMKRPLNNEPISNTTRKRVLSKVAPWQAKMFEERWGKIRNKENLYRFFLMNEFVENFETEVEEDYFGVLWSDIHWSLEIKGYSVVYANSYTLPYRKKQVKKLFNHSMNDITHRNLIMMRTGEREENNIYELDLR